MQYFSVYDLLLNKVQENGGSLNDMYVFFKKRKINKTQITELQQTAYIPTEKNFRKALCDFLNMTELEIELSMGKIPASYRDSYFQNIKEIARLLSKAEKNTTSRLSPYFENKLGCLYYRNTESCKFKGFSLKCRNTHEINSFSTPLNT